MFINQIKFMKKVIGLFLVLLISTVSVYAQNNKREGRVDPEKRIDMMVKELKLDDKQAVGFRKVQKDFMDEMKKMRDTSENDRDKMREKMKTMRTDRDAKVKKILTEEQYKLYQEKQSQPRRDGNKPGSKEGGKKQDRRK